MKRWILIISIAFCLVVGALFASHNHYKNVVIAIEQNKILNIVTSVSNQLESYFSENDLYYQELIGSSDFLNDFKNSLKHDMDSFVALDVLYRLRKEQYDTIDIYDAKGQRIKAFSDKDTHQISSKSIEKAMLDKQNVYYIDVEAQPSIHMVYVLTEFGNPIGYVRFVYNAEYIYTNYIKEYRLHQTGYISLKDSQGRLFLHPSGENIGTDVLVARRTQYPNYDWSELEESVSRQMQGETGVGSYYSVWPGDGSWIKKINAYTPCYIGNTFLILNFSIDYKETLYSFEGITKATIIITLILTLMSILSIIYILQIETKRAALHVEAKYFEDIKQKNALIDHQSKHAAMGEMIATITHQLKQPLNALKLSLYNLEDHIDVLDDHTKKLIDANHQSIAKMSKSIDDFRSFFKPQEAKTWFEISAAIDFALAINYDRLHVHRIQVEQDVPHITLFGKSNYLSQVFLNILNNAIEAIAQQHKEGRIVVSAHRHDDHVYISFEDTGGGIDESIASHLFKPYVTSKGDEGTGLGLYICKYILEKKFNGSIHIQNHALGCKVTVIIPEEKEDDN